MSAQEGSTAGVEPPKGARQLRAALDAAARRREATVKRLQALVGNVIVAQMLPDAAVKGGTGLKLRFGDRLTRETPDLDAAFRGDREAFLSELETRLRAGWGDFAGTAIVGKQRAPEQLLDRVTLAYVMLPVLVKLTYREKSFMSIDLEIGYDELEATTTDPVEHEMSSDVLDLFAELGLPEPAPVRVLPLHHQMSQKLHACSEPGSPRAHDLVDLQLMAPSCDPALVRQTAERLFAFRASHSWPPTVVAGEGWASRYADAADGLDVLDMKAAVDWVNEYIRSL
ncbi:nucleotidyl transferase AbiEii/AbiGii toxin family protein [Knoellia aerolata]|uniref:Nucleotidyl transferase AbiEii/AbiGii toxin family protein n=1 Tax=Knoellia aerolata DSM 18566 TaxID=1385519 RepID=A0A0A0JVS8_9MICO|nr:nucleotidyl transferase AbiEii/AbiGii toxin family protein [Knoellia aerolata]KGN40794.1 hypothetical protein N801_12270 [Knoellia aerolata DSM 18566]